MLTYTYCYLQFLMQDTTIQAHSFIHPHTYTDAYKNGSAIITTKTSSSKKGLVECLCQETESLTGFSALDNGTIICSVTQAK